MTGDLYPVTTLPPSRVSSPVQSLETRVSGLVSGLTPVRYRVVWRPVSLLFRLPGAGVRSSPGYRPGVQRWNLTLPSRGTPCLSFFCRKVRSGPGSNIPVSGVVSVWYPPDPGLEVRRSGHRVGPGPPTIVGLSWVSGSPQHMEPSQGPPTFCTTGPVLFLLTDDSYDTRPWVRELPSYSGFRDSWGESPRYHLTTSGVGGRTTGMQERSRWWCWGSVRVKCLQL